MRTLVRHYYISGLMLRRVRRDLDTIWHFYLMLVLMFSSFFLGLRTATAQLNSGILYQEYQDALVFISVKMVDLSGTSSSQTGTGFLLTSDGFVLTANHVIPELSTNYKSVQATGVTGSRHSSASAQKLEIIARDSDLDLLLLKFPETGQAFKPVRIHSLNRPRIQRGATLRVMGFPLNDDLAVTPGSLLNMNAERGRWQTDLKMTTGHSGGPVFNQDGEVVAIAVRGVPSSSVNHYIVPIQYARRLLDIANYGSSQTPQADLPTSQTGWTIYWSPYTILPVEDSMRLANEINSWLPQQVKRTITTHLEALETSRQLAPNRIPEIPLQKLSHKIDTTNTERLRTYGQGLNALAMISGWGSLDRPGGI